jgi:hypothetical protein
VTTSSAEGRTSRQLQDAPQGALFVWCNERISYPKGLARFLKREDIEVLPLSALSFVGMCNRCPSVVIVDHAANLSAEALYVLSTMRIRSLSSNTTKSHPMADELPEM